MDVAVNYVRSSAEAETVAEQVRAMGRKAAVLQADMADMKQATALYDRATADLGPLSALVANAGITRDRLLIQMSEEDWDATWLTDLAGPRALCEVALQRMSESGGKIVTVSSVVGSVGNAGQANYATAKSAIEGLTRELAVLGGPSEITVNCVVPGYITTDAVAHLTEQQVITWYDRIPMRRAGTVDDIAELIAYLCGSGSGYITGQCIAVDGGLLARAGAGFRS
jgi:3-oxoacyl-[acyl-carrier protein] reductase